jgi:predicted MFS family arabinose efflux permease
VTVFRNPRFSAASLSITFVFFALMGVLFFLTTYMQAVLGYSALETGTRVLPVAFGMVMATRLSVKLVRKAGTKVVVAGGLTTVAVALSLYTGFDVDTAYAQFAVALFLMGLGMGLAMSPATEAIMGALPRAKAGVGSAMNDVVRELGGTLGVAVLGSVLTSSYGAAMDGATAGLPPAAAEAAGDNVGAAQQIGAQLGGRAGATLIDAADGAFIDALATTASLAAAAALIGALIALAFLPARARADSPARLDGLLSGSA